MSDILKAIVLGIVQGLTEFLPISSSAHLIYVPWLFGWKPFGLAFDVATHIGTLGAVLLYFRRDLWQMLNGGLHGLGDIVRFRAPADPMGKLGLWIIFGTIPAVIVGFLVESRVDAYFHQDPISRTALAISACVLIAMGILLGVADRVGRHRLATGSDGRTLNDLTFRDALIVGLAQATALFPGVSRSGSTITAGLFLGMKRPTAARFSFLLGVPAILGAGLKQTLDMLQEGIPADERSVFVVGILTSFVVGFLAIAGLMRFLERRSVDAFVVYRILVGAGVLLLLVAGFRA